MATLQDVATRAGVSISTVSRVINRSVPVDAVTEQRVLEAVEALGYRPNLLARSFRRRETQTIGLLVPDNSNPFFAEIARVIEDEGFARGYSVILCNSDLSPEKQAVYVHVLLDKRVDGLILTSSGLIRPDDGTDVMDRIFASRVPCVTVDRDLGDSPIDQVLVDNERGGYQAAAYLLALGHRHYACVAGPSDRTPSAGRVAGFQRGLAQAGITLDANAIVRGNGRHDGGVAATQELLRRGVAFTAIFAFNDMMALGVIGTLLRSGLAVPRDVSVLGFDNIPSASATFPAITTIAQPIEELGRTSVRLLIDRIAKRGGPYRRVELQTSPVERESCGPPHS